MSDAKTNAYFCQFSASSNTTKGMFHQFEQKMCERLLAMAIEDAPMTISINRDDLDKQPEAKRKKEEMIEKKSWKKQKRALSRHCINGRCTILRHVGKASIGLFVKCWGD